MQELDKGLLIDVKLPLKKVKEHFVEMFPYLTVSFFKNGTEISKLRESLPILQLTPKDNSETFQIYEDMSVQEVVDTFWNQLGIQVVIFRMLGQNLVETTFTSKWTLKHQNRVGSKVYFDHESK